MGTQTRSLLLLVVVVLCTQFVKSESYDEEDYYNGHKYSGIGVTRSKIEDVTDMQNDLDVLGIRSNWGEYPENDAQEEDEEDAWFRLPIPIKKVFDLYEDDVDIQQADGKKGTTKVDDMRMTLKTGETKVQIELVTARPKNVGQCTCPKGQIPVVEVMRDDVHYQEPQLVNEILKLGNDVNDLEVDQNQNIEANNESEYDLPNYQSRKRRNVEIHEDYVNSDEGYAKADDIKVNDKNKEFILKIEELSSGQENCKCIDAPKPKGPPFVKVTTNPKPNPGGPPTIPIVTVKPPVKPIPNPEGKPELPKCRARFPKSTLSSTNTGTIPIILPRRVPQLKDVVETNEFQETENNGIQLETNQDNDNNMEIVTDEIELPTEYIEGPDEAEYDI